MFDHSIYQYKTRINNRELFILPNTIGCLLQSPKSVRFNPYFHYFSHVCINHVTCSFFEMSYLCSHKGCTKWNRNAVDWWKGKEMGYGTRGKHCRGEKILLRLKFHTPGKKC